MNYDQFLKLTRERARLDNDADALRAIDATLTVLAERLYGNEANQLGAQLPPQVAAFLSGAGASKKFNLEEFYNKVSQRESVGVDLAHEHARAVMSVVAETVTPGELLDILAQLPQEWDELLTFSSDYRKLEGK
jgi:uncharacterized protein (DUF2267 family)